MKFLQYNNSEQFNMNFDKSTKKDYNTLIQNYIEIVRMD